MSANNIKLNSTTQISLHERFCNPEQVLDISWGKNICTNQSGAAHNPKIFHWLIANNELNPDDSSSEDHEVSDHRKISVTDRHSCA